VFAVWEFLLDIIFTGNHLRVLVTFINLLMATGHKNLGDIDLASDGGRIDMTFGRFDVSTRKRLHHHFTAFNFCGILGTRHLLLVTARLLFLHQNHAVDCCWVHMAGHLQNVLTRKGLLHLDVARWTRHVTPRLAGMSALAKFQTRFSAFVEFVLSVIHVADGLTDMRTFEDDMAEKIAASFRCFGLKISCSLDSRNISIDLTN
jgi:hypothetical protein